MPTTKKRKVNKKPTRIKKKETPQQNTLRNEVLSIIAFVMALFIYISVSKAQGIPEDIQVIGWMGSRVAVGLEMAFGKGAIVVSFLLLAWAIHLGMYKQTWSIRMWGVSLLFICVLIYYGLYDIPSGLNPWTAGQRGMGGGLLGGGIAYIFIQLVGQVGGVIFLVLGICISLLFIINQPLVEIGVFITTWFTKTKDWLSKVMFYEVEEEEKPVPATRRTEPIIIDHGIETPTAEKPGYNWVEMNVSPDLEIVREKAVTPLPTSEPLKEVKREDNPNYQKPSLELLSEISSERSIDKKNIKESISVLEETFANFGIGVKVNQVSCGPAVTRYELTPAPGVKVSRIISLTDDLQLNLAAPGIRIEAPIPGKSAVGIEVPNSKILSVGLRSLLSSPAFRRLNSPLAFALGEDISGSSVVAKLADMPHLLIAGSTGSGKSVCLNCIIMSLLYNAIPEELKLVFIDPKMVELTVYNGIPHLMCPVVTDPKRAAVILRWMVTEMEKRYRLFAEKGVRDIGRYNQSADKKMPYIVIVIDELADLMMVAPVEVEDSICRLAQMARAAGMHLIVATQRPSVDVVTGVIKANIPSRIAFAVSSQADSRTILDMSGAEKLLGKGDMLFFPVGAVKPYRVQGAYVSDQDIDKTVEFIKQQAYQSEDEAQLKEMEFSLEQADLEPEDDLFWEAVAVFVDSEKASVSLLQRRLRIGYARAARLVDLMEDRGIVSQLDANKKREVLIDSDQLEKLYANQRSM
jgi:S-DNA-T family DNA segregation ATPase FtsK/SpoIIIE